jgi:hypothetical protein
MSKSVRVTISIPAGLKARMEAIEEPTNWSAVAAKAFEDEVSQINAKRGFKTMEDAIARLKASKRKSRDADEHIGGFAGRQWAMERAEVDELERLAAAIEGRDWESTFWDTPGDAYGTDEHVLFLIRPEDDGDRQAAERFWAEAGIEEFMAPERRTAFVRGFTDAAYDFWREVRDKL